MRVLLVDDSPDTIQILDEVVRYLGHQPVSCGNASDALAEFAKTPFPLVLTDLRMPGMTGLEMLGELRQLPGGDTCDVVIVTGQGDMNTAIDALRKGAYDYLNKPVNAKELAAVVERSAEHQALLAENRAMSERMDEQVAAATQSLRQDLDAARAKLREVSGIGAVVFASSAVQPLLAKVDILHGDPSVPVLIEGETGTGKEIVARMIHYGPDATLDLPFVDINCSALAPELVDAELFGYEKGAFTGGKPEGAAGKLEAAGAGTLFLDEIGDMPLELQPKLLRVLQDRTYYRVGGLKKLAFSARIICATNRRVESLIKEGRFRQDLFYRLNVGHLRIPPLRDRPEDIIALAEFFLQREAERKRKRFRGIADDALRLLQGHPWPGNVRQLENVIERVALLEDDEALRPEHLRFLSGGTAEDAPDAEDASDGAGDVSAAGKSQILHLADFDLPEGEFDIEDYYTSIVQKALEKFEGNKTRAARYLGISRHALLRRLQKTE